MSQQTQYTPGPWTLRIDPDRDYRRSGVEIEIESNGFVFSGVAAARDIDGTGRCFSNDVARANARLIAAAPEMLAALEYTLDQAGIDPASPCHKVIVAAIARAQGKE